MTHITYRHELDGVRAIAVMSVVLYHVGFPSLSGGFTGVDIFFVLSGYLIGGQTYLRLERGDYSVIEFFTRRIRRLSMAYFAVFMVTALMALWLYLPFELVDVQRNLIGSVTFTNNYNLLFSQGYFNSGAEENPFLHTWSLSIEEQFYIVLPVLILLTRRSATGFRITLIAVFCISLLLTLFSGDLIFDRDQRYFASSFRVWEIALGALVFLGLHRRGALLRLPFAPLIGLVMVLVPVGWLDGQMLYPGWEALVATLGVALIIATADPARSPVARVLASGVMSYIGRISYGTYLWHWPLIVFVQYVGVDLSDPLRAGLFFASLGLGALSHHLIETPVRRLSVARHRRTLWAMFALQTALMFAVAGWLGHVAKSADAGQQVALSAIKAESEVYHNGWMRCWNKVAADEVCRFGPADQPADFVLWGDSMANSAAWAMQDYAKATGQAGYLLTAPSCAPLSRVARDFSDTQECLAFNASALQHLMSAPRTRVILFARWSYYGEGFRNHKTDTGGSVALVDRDKGLLPGEPLAIFTADFRETVKQLATRHEVVVINQLPVFPVFVPKAMLRAERFGAEMPVRTRASFEARDGRLVDFIAKQAEPLGYKVLSLHEELCRTGTCAHALDGVPLFSDHVHLSRHGNRWLTRKLIELLPPAQAD